MGGSVVAGNDDRDPGSSGTQRKRRRRRKRAKRERPELERREIVSTVCGYICREGLTAMEVQTKMREEHGVEISREDPYRIFHQVAKKGWITFTPPQEYSLRRRIKEERYPWLHEVSVVQTGVSEDVAHRGARMLIELLQQHHAGEVVHVGFSGGVGMRTLAERLAQLLRGGR